MSQYAIRPLLAKCTEHITYWSVPPLRCALFRCSGDNERTLQTLVITFTRVAVGCCGCCRHVNTSADSAVLVLLLWEQSLHSGNSKCISETLNDNNSNAGSALTVPSKEYRHCTVCCCCCCCCGRLFSSRCYGNSHCISETVNAFRTHPTTTKTMRP